MAFDERRRVKRATRTFTPATPISPGPRSPSRSIVVDEDGARHRGGGSQGQPIRPTRPWPAPSMVGSSHKRLPTVAANNAISPDEPRLSLSVGVRSPQMSTYLRRRLSDHRANSQEIVGPTCINAAPGTTLNATWARTRWTSAPTGRLDPRSGKAPLLLRAPAEPRRSPAAADPPTGPPGGHPEGN